MLKDTSFGLNGLGNGEESPLVQCNAHSGTISMLLFRKLKLLFPGHVLSFVQMMFCEK
jgi:hypothetical protein